MPQARQFGPSLLGMRKFATHALPRRAPFAYRNGLRARLHLALDSRGRTAKAQAQALALVMLRLDLDVCVADRGGRLVAL